MLILMLVGKVDFSAIVEKLADAQKILNWKSTRPCIP
jgi:hypothetical protein